MSFQKEQSPRPVARCGLPVNSIGKDKTTSSEYTDIIEAVEAAKAETRSKQAHRLVDYLLTCPGALSGEISRACSIGNVSCAASYIRPALEKRGIALVATPPEQKVVNRFGEPSQSHEWRLQKLVV